MKKMLVACALALAVTAVSQQSASAWWEVKWSAGFNVCIRGAGNCRGWVIGRYAQIGPYPGCADCGYGSGFGGGMFANYPAYGSYDVASSWQAPAPQANSQAPAYAASAAPQSYSPYANTGYQPVGYSYPGYQQYQTPSYWYGR